MIGTMIRKEPNYPVETGFCFDDDEYTLMNEFNMNNSQEDNGKKCRIIFRFVNPISMYEKVVAALVTKKVHCDTILDDPETHSRGFCFSAYMNTNFSMNLMSR
jgi:hypothetical protein